jgi:hypothetical protein
VSGVTSASDRRAILDNLARGIRLGTYFVYAGVAIAVLSWVLLALIRPKDWALFGVVFCAGVVSIAVGIRGRRRLQAVRRRRVYEWSVEDQDHSLG